MCGVRLQAGRSGRSRIPRHQFTNSPMSNITATDVKKLRDQTGAGMMECKAALTEADGNFEDANLILRKRGLASAAKKAGRATSEGLVGHRVSADHRNG